MAGTPSLSPDTSGGAQGSSRSSSLIRKATDGTGSKLFTKSGKAPTIHSAVAPIKHANEVTKIPQLPLKALPDGVKIEPTEKVALTPDKTEEEPLVQPPKEGSCSLVS